MMMRVLRLGARVALDDPQPALARAAEQAAAGDESWAQWVEEYRRGEALIVCLTVTLEVCDGKPESVEIANRGVFLESDPQPPKVEQQVAEVVGKDFSALADRLAQRGLRLDEGELDRMFVHVELGDDVHRSLSAMAESGKRRDGRVQADAGVSRPEVRTGS